MHPKTQLNDALNDSSRRRIKKRRPELDRRRGGAYAGFWACLLELMQTRGSALYTFWMRGRPAFF